MEKIIILILFIVSCNLVLSEGTPTSDSFTKYLGSDVSVQVCNATIVQGTLINDSADYIVVHDLCTPEVGDVLINKKCVVMLYQGCDCIE